MSVQFNVSAARANLLHADDYQHVREILSRVGDKWTFVILAALRERCMRFNDLHRAIDGISQRMLVVTLRHLERDGFVARTVYPTVPPRVEYELSERGRWLGGGVQPRAGWGRGNPPTHQESPPRFDSQIRRRTE